MFLFQSYNLGDGGAIKDELGLEDAVRAIKEGGNYWKNNWVVVRKAFQKGPQSASSGREGRASYQHMSDIFFGLMFRAGCEETETIWVIGPKATNGFSSVSTREQARLDNCLIDFIWILR